MSDYDTMGLAPGDEDDLPTTMENGNSDERVRCPKQMVQVSGDPKGGEMIHVNYGDDINPTGKSKFTSTIDQETPDDDNGNVHRMLLDDRDRYTNHKSMTRDEHVESIRGRVRIEEVWNHAEQSYVVKGWRARENEEPMPNSESGDIACFFRGQRKKRMQNIPESNNDLGSLALLRLHIFGCRFATCVSPSVRLK